MPNYKIAKEVLSEVEKDRILCVYLNSTGGEVDWATATQEYGAASVESMKKSLQNTLKKLEKAVAAGYTPSEADTPKTSGNKGRKRKPDAGGDLATPSKKAKQAGSKWDIMSADLQNGENDETGSGVKQEAAEEE